MGGELCTNGIVMQELSFTLSYVYRIYNHVHLLTDSYIVIFPPLLQLLAV